MQQTHDGGASFGGDGPISGRYRIVAELARGGMSVVYLALVRGPGGFNKLVSLKQLKADLAQDPALVAMFLTEARLAARLGHPNVVHTMAVESGGGFHYIVMEYLDGQPLHRIVSRGHKTRASMPMHMQLAVLSGALEGLVYAHSAVGYDGAPLAIVHRDVSPHNVFVTYDGQIKLLDFGIAKAADSDDETRAGVVKGKMAYMAPEQAACGLVDPRADIFAMGVLLWEAASGRRFWSTATDGQILRALIDGNDPLARPGAMDGVPEPLRPVIRRATAFSPGDRPPNAVAFRADLREAMGKLTVPDVDPAGIGGFVRDLFAEDRLRLQEAIDAQLRSAREMSTGEFAIRSVPRIDVPTPPSGAIVPGRPLGDGPASDRGPSMRTTLSPILADDAPVRRPYGRRVKIGIAAAAAVALAAVAATVASVASRSSTTSDAPAASRETSPPTVAPPTATSEPARVDTIRVDVRVTPAHARVIVDGHDVGEGRYTGTVPRDGARHTVRVEAERYLAWEEAFDARSDFARAPALQPVMAAWPAHLRVKPVASAAASPAPQAAPEPPPVARPPLPIDSNNPYAR